jgi:hypothetical protein
LAVLGSTICDNNWTEQCSETRARQRQNAAHESRGEWIPPAVWNPFDISVQKARDELARKEAREAQRKIAFIKKAE